MTIPFWRSDGNAVAYQATLEEMVKACGQRAATLAQLRSISQQLGFSVPEFLVIPAAVAHDINIQYDGARDTEGSAYLAVSKQRTDAYEALLRPYLRDIASAVTALTPRNPILRGSSLLEGSNSLSFAGVCKTVIPQQDMPLEDHLRIGLAKVLAGSFTPYADYYLSHHNIPSRGRDVGLIIMELVGMPIIHATAYAYPNELRIRYFLNPVVGSHYAGGHEMILRQNDGSTLQLPDHAQGFGGTWRHIAKVLWGLHASFYGEAVPIDVEFLVDQSGGTNTLHIVQLRPVSRPHEKNYLQAQALLRASKLWKEDIVIPPSHLYHSVGDVTDGTVVDLRDPSQLLLMEALSEGITSPVFIVPHVGGEGTFNFLKSLPRTVHKGTALIMHPEHRQHDHLQYSVYEDRRLDMVIHCDEAALSSIGHGDSIALTSNGNTASLELKKTP